MRVECYCGVMGDLSSFTGWEMYCQPLKPEAVLADMVHKLHDCRKMLTVTFRRAE